MQYVLKKDLIEHARFRALATSIINPKTASEIFDEYRKEAFPWVETQKSRDKEATLKVLLEEVARGGLGVTPLWQANKKVRSRMKTKVIQTDQPLVRSKEEMSRLYEKMGKVRP